MNEEAQKSRPVDHDGLAERVTDPKRIVSVIKGLITHRSLLTVTVPDRNGQYISVVFRADPEEGTFCIDDLSAGTKKIPPVEGGELTIRSMIDGVQVYFRAPIVSHGEEEGHAFYRLALPQLVFRAQKRDAFRVRVGAAKQVPVSLKGEAGTELVGRLRDLSTGGAGMVFSGEPPIREGMLLRNCMIDLPAEGRLVCTLEVRYVYHNRDRNELQVGTKFIGMQGQQQRVIQRCVVALEREARRKRASI